MRHFKDTLHAGLLASLFIHCVFSQGVEDDESQEEQLPRYLRDDGIKRVATLKQSNFEKTLKHTKMLVALFYMASKDHPESEKAWKSDEQMLEVNIVLTKALSLIIFLQRATILGQKC